MFATPYFSLRKICLATIFVTTFTMISGSAMALEIDTDKLTKQFYSFIPAKPDFRMPRLDDIKLWKSDMAKARKAFRQQKYKHARKYFERALDNGNYAAAWYLGHIYRRGLGVAVNPRRAVMYYGVVAQQYHPDGPRDRMYRLSIDSIVKLADYYRRGAERVKQDPIRAFDLYNIAAAHGHSGAQYGLGLMYLNGEGGKPSPSRALRWLLASATHHYAPAKAAIGDIYWDGKFVRQNKAQALMWYELAIQTARQDRYPGIYAKFDQMLAEVSGDERRRAEILAANWSEQHPINGKRALIMPTSSKNAPQESAAKKAPSIIKNITEGMTGNLKEESHQE